MCYDWHRMIFKMWEERTERRLYLLKLYMSVRAKGALLGAQSARMGSAPNEAQMLIDGTARASAPPVLCLCAKASLALASGLCAH